MLGPVMLGCDGVCPSCQFQSIVSFAKRYLIDVHCWILKLQFKNLPFFFTFMWLCIVTNFFIIKPTSCTNFPNLLRHETLHVSGSSSVHHQEFSHCTLGTGIYHTGLKTDFEQDQDGTAVPSWLCLEAVIKNLHETYQCRMYSRELPMMSREDARNVKSFDRINLDN